MQINLVSCVFVLNNQKNNNIRKNDIKKLKVLVDKNLELPTININESDIKKQIKKNISNIIGSNVFHLEQVYAMDYKNNLDIIYLSATNIENIRKLKEEYQLINFEIKENNLIILDNKEYEYTTIEIEENNNIEYIHDIKVKDKHIKRTLMNLLISYKRIRSNIDNTDIIFKFMPSTFTLEDVRIVYELIKNCNVDKSNFRKRVIKYCEKDDSPTNEKNGYRPSQKYKFKKLKGDIWL